MHQSIPSANIPPSRATPGFCTYFQPGSRGFVPSKLPWAGGCPGVGPIIKVPSFQLTPHRGTFQLQTDLCGRVAEWLRRRVGTRKVPGSNPVVGTAYTHSHQSTHLSTPSGSVNEYPGYSF